MLAPIFMWICIFLRSRDSLHEAALSKPTFISSCKIANFGDFTKFLDSKITLDSKPQSHFKKSFPPKYLASLITLRTDKTWMGQRKVNVTFAKRLW